MSILLQDAVSLWQCQDQVCQKHARYDRRLSVECLRVVLAVDVFRFCMFCMGIMGTFPCTFDSFCSVTPLRHLPKRSMVTEVQLPMRCELSRSRKKMAVECLSSLRKPFQMWHVFQLQWHIHIIHSHMSSLWFIMVHSQGTTWSPSLTALERWWATSLEMSQPYRI